MKNLNKILVAAMMILSLSSNAQDSNNPWAFSFGVNAIDTRTDAGGGRNWLDRHFSQPFNVKDNWNILPALTYIGVSKYVGDNFTFGVSGSLNKMNKFVTYSPANGYVASNPGDLLYYGIDSIVMTKVDVLNGIEKIQVLNNGKLIEFNGWNSNKDSNLDSYIEYIESEIKIPIEGISFGSGRNDLIMSKYEEIL